jgi:hypothetical protein
VAIDVDALIDDRVAALDVLQHHVLRVDIGLRVLLDLAFITAVNVRRFPEIGLRGSYKHN